MYTVASNPICLLEQTTEARVGGLLRSGQYSLPRHDLNEW